MVVWQAAVFAPVADLGLRSQAPVVLLPTASFYDLRPWLFSEWVAPTTNKTTNTKSVADRGLRSLAGVRLGRMWDSVSRPALHQGGVADRGLRSLHL